MRNRGEFGEEMAAEYLKTKGYQILERNWRGSGKLKCPEIDIIAGRQNMIVFVEVKTSSTGLYGEPENWITAQKRRRLTAGASAYIASISQDKVPYPLREYRFDVIAIDLQVKPPRINHIINAFPASDMTID